MREEIQTIHFISRINASVAARVWSAALGAALGVLITGGGPAWSASLRPSDGCPGEFSTTTTEVGQVPFSMGQRRPQTILIITAMDAEERAARDVLPAGESVVLSPALGLGATVHRRGGRQLILAKAGIGAVNAGVLTALAAERWSLDGVLLLGVAGALDPDLRIGDAVLGSSVLQHDSVFTGDATEFMAPGQPFVSVAPEARVNPLFTTDAGFNAWAAGALPGVRAGCLLTGGEFVGNAHRKLQLASARADALAVEMEAGGVLVVTERLGLPFGVIKTIADRLNPDLTISHDYNAFLGGACRTAAVTIQKIWEGWADDPSI